MANKSSKIPEQEEQEKYKTMSGPFKMKGSPYKKKKVKTVKNKDGSITKTDTKTGKSSTYRASKTETGKGKKYTRWL